MDCGTPRTLDGPFRCVIHQTCCRSLGALLVHGHSCTMHMSFLPTLLLGVLMVPRYPGTGPVLTAQRTSGCSEPILSNWLPCCFSVPSYVAAKTSSGVPASYCLAAARLFHEHSVPSRSLASLLVVAG